MQVFTVIPSLVYNIKFLAWVTIFSSRYTALLTGEIHSLITANRTFEIMPSWILTTLSQNDWQLYIQSFLSLFVIIIVTIIIIIIITFSSSNGSYSSSSSSIVISTYSITIVIITIVIGNIFIVIPIYIIKFLRYILIHPFASWISSTRSTLSFSVQLNGSHQRRWSRIVNMYCWNYQISETI